MTVEQRLVSAFAEAVASKLPGGPWYRRTEAAELVGVTPGALGALAAGDRHPELKPKQLVRWRGQIVGLYDDESLRALREHFARPSAGAGRPRMWSPAEARRRRKVRDQIRHYTLRAERLAEKDPDAARESSTRARELQSALDAEFDRRNAARVGS